MTHAAYNCTSHDPDGPSQPELFIHIGLHKTGTTYLQSSVFPELELNYLRRDDPSFQPYLKRIRHQDPIVFDADAVREGIAPLLREGKNLISDEGLSGSPLQRYANRDAILCKLHRVFPNAVIIVAIREQRDLIDSMYRQYIAAGGTHKLCDVLSETGSGVSYDQIDLESLCFSKYLTRIEEMFGRNQLQVLVYEDLVCDRKRFLSRIEETVGVQLPNEPNSERRNVSLPPKVIPLRRRLNRIFMSRARNNGFLPRPPFLDGMLRRLAFLVPTGSYARERQALEGMAERYGDDSRLISDRYDLELDVHPYKKDKYFPRQEGEAL